MSEIKECVEDFDINANSYSNRASTSLNQVTINGIDSNFVYLKEEHYSAKITINFINSKNNRIFIGNNLNGNIRLGIQGNNSLIYIGNYCNLNDFEIRSFQNDDLIVVGNGVSTTGRSTLISGNGSGSSKPAIIVGDDCMFSYDIVIRNSDAHPIFDLNTLEQVNMPSSLVILEPHVWVGEQVSVLKDVRIGACSVIGLGSIVTKNIPRFSIAKGVPATWVVKRNLFWARSYSETARRRALYFTDKYGFSGPSESESHGEQENRLRL